jgi:predicted acylesterase/phospholipase RssA
MYTHALSAPSTMSMEVANKEVSVDDPAGSSDVLDNPISWEGDRLRRRISDDYAKGRKRQRIGQEPTTMATSLPLATTTTTTTTTAAAEAKVTAQRSMTGYSTALNQQKHGAAAAARNPTNPSINLPGADVNPRNHRVSMSPSHSSIGISNHQARMDQSLPSRPKPNPLQQISNNETNSVGTNADADVSDAPNSMTGKCRSEESSIIANNSEESMHTSPTRATATATATATSPSHGEKVTVVMLIIASLVTWVVCVNALLTPLPVRMHGHLLAPKHGRRTQTQIAPDGTSTTTTTLAHPIPTDRTLRDFLTDSAGFHLAMAPSFFGFYGYFGALAAWEEGIDASILSPGVGKIHSVAGASAGAMAAILIAAGIKPRRAADFVAGMTLDKFADYPAVGAFLRGNKFEQIMFDFMRSEQPNMSLLLQDSILPVAVTAFDLQTMQGQILSRGSMARAARASATFPVLFQPVAWKGNVTNGEDYILIDGGVTDWAGVDGLKVLFPDQPKRVVNLVVGDFTGSDGPPGPSAVPGSTEVLSITMQNLPLCSPFHMTNGPITVDAAHRAMMATLDLPLYKGREANHFELHIDTDSFWKGKKANQETIVDTIV